MTAIPLILDKSYPTAAILRIAAVMAAMLMVREEREAEADELRPEPEPEVVEDVCEVRLDQKSILCGGATPRWIARVTLKAVIEVMEEEFGVTAAGARGDAEGGLEDDL